MAELPDAVLFTCNLNKVRSPMAAALMRRRFGDRIYVDSCGLQAADALDPFATAVMEEVDLDLSGHAPKTFDMRGVGTFDVVISLTEAAHARAVEMARREAVAVEHWPILDPTEGDGSREQKLQLYRRVRDELDRRIQDRFPVSG